MLTGRPGARSAAARLGAAESSGDARDGGPLDPRLGDGRRRPGAYLDMKIHLEKNLEEERKILTQQQKIFRNRARKYFVESNRRKKYFEEKQKEQEEREHEIREQILQQRKQKIEEVTEKFQRAHVPLSQRRRAVFQKTVPSLEEALKQIQESNLKSQVNVPSSHRPTINLRAIGNALPSSLSKNDQKHLVSTINCDKKVKENNRIHLATNKDVFQLKLMETQKFLEDQHQKSLQKFCDEVNQITNSEILSSIDSLEAGEHEQIYLTLTNKEPPTSVQQNSVFLKSANLQAANLDCFDKDKLSFSKTQHINNWLKNLDNPNTQTDIPFSDILSKPNVLPLGECFNSKEQNPSALSRTVEETTNSNNLLDFICSSPIFIPNEKIKKTSETSTMRAADFCFGAFKRERPSVTESPTFKCSKAWGTPDSLTEEMATISDQVKYSELTQENRITSIPTSFVPVAASLILPSNTQSTEPLPNNIIHMNEIDPGQCSDNLGEIKDDKKIKYLNSKKEELPLFSDNFPAAYIPHNSDSKDKKQEITETSTLLSDVISNYELVGQQKKRKYNIDGKSSVRFLKSILKKESKYEHDSFKAVINQGFKLRNQKAEAIRDSIELTKEKGGNAEIPKTIKKLRWVDETEYNHSLKNGRKISQQWSQSFLTQTNSDVSNNIISVPACAVNSANRKKTKDDSISENLAASGESRTNHVYLNCFIPSAFNTTKQAWPASEKEESKSPIHNSDSETQKANVQRRREKVIRTKSAQVQSGFLYTNRKGTIIRAQSANKANTFLQPQGKLVVPHPPKTPPNIRSDKNIQVFQCQSEMPENSQNIITNNYFTLKHVLPAEHKMNQWNKVCSLPLSHVCSNSIPAIPSLPYCSEGQTLAKTNHSNGTQIIAQQGGTLYCTQRCPVYEESHLSKAFRPTKEESVPSWKRRHNSLGQNEKAADSTFMRRKRIVENKQRNLLEQRKQNLGSVGQKCSEQMNNFGQRVQLSSSKPKEATQDTSNIEEVSDSISEFLMAENLVKSSVAEDDILSVMSNKQQQKNNLASNKAQQWDICALSAEEQKVLQSLNRLNERLFYVQATICKNPSIKNALQIMPLLNMEPRTSLSPNIGSRLYRKY